MEVLQVSAKSTPGDGSHGRGVKGQLAEVDRRGPIAFLRDMTRGLWRLRRR